MDFDPRDYDSRDDERHSQTPSRGGRSGSGDRHRDDDWSQPTTRPRDRDDDDARSLGRGPGNERQGSDGHERDRDHDPRWADRDRDDRERDRDVPDAFTRHVHLPRGLERELVHDRDREYTLRGSESRTLATVGAFRVVSSRDLRDHDGSPADPRSGDLRHSAWPSPTRWSTSTMPARRSSTTSSKARCIPRPLASCSGSSSIGVSRRLGSPCTR